MIKTSYKSFLFPRSKTYAICWTHLSALLCTFVNVYIFCMGGPSWIQPPNTNHAPSVPGVMQWFSIHRPRPSAVMWTVLIILLPCFRSRPSLWIPHWQRMPENRVFLFASRRKHLTHAHAAAPTCNRKRSAAWKAIYNLMLVNSSHCHTLMSPAIIFHARLPNVHYWFNINSM